MGLAAALGLATSRAVTDLRQYINSDLGFSDLEIILTWDPTFAKMILHFTL